MHCWSVDTSLHCAEGDSQVEILSAGSSSSSTADVEDDHVYYGDDEDAAVLAEGIIFIIRVSMHTLIQIKWGVCVTCSVCGCVYKCVNLHAVLPSL